MKAKNFLFILFIISAYNSFSQIQTRRLNFILLIDNEVPNPSIIDSGYFIIKDTSGIVQYRIPFKYQVGGIEMLSSDYEKLFSLNTPRYKVIIKFRYNRFVADCAYAGEYDYENMLPEYWINEVYIILKVHNYFNLESRQKYALEKNGYSIEFNTPLGSQLVPTNKKYYDKWIKPVKCE